MSEVRKHFISTLVNLDTNTFSIDPQPGDMVRFYMDLNSIGTVVEKIDENNAKVLWSNFKNPFDNIVRSITRNYTQISQQTFQVQPMPPGTLPFYLDMVEKE